MLVQGQEPLTASMLAAAPPQEQKQMLGERLFPLIQRMYPDLAGKITGMLLEIDNSELLHMLESNESLEAKVRLTWLECHCNWITGINNKIKGRKTWWNCWSKAYKSNSLNHTVGFKPTNVNIGIMPALWRAMYGDHFALSCVYQVAIRCTLKTVAHTLSSKL